MDPNFFYNLLEKIASFYNEGGHLYEGEQFPSSKTKNTGSVHYTPWCFPLTSSALLSSSYCYLVAVGVQLCGHTLSLQAKV